jgi:transcriptional regulator with XRE-family HTH domain
MGRDGSAIRAVLARNVRRLRLARGLSQEALAADAGLHQGLISEIEHEAANPELDTLGQLATALGARPRDLFEE